VNKFTQILTATAIVTAASLCSDGQSTPAPAQDSAAAAPSGGITRQQADQILSELRAIHQLLERQQLAAAPPQIPSNPTGKVTMSVATGWYSLGRDDAPVTVVEFADYQCPFCRRFQSDTFTELKKSYIDTGKVRFVSRDLPLEFHSNAPNAAAAARCAGEQGKYWEIRDLLLASDADLSQASLLKDGQQVRLDTTEFGACLSARKYDSAIRKDVTDAGSLGISGTPSFVVGKTAKDQINGVLIVGAVPFSVFETAIRNQLNTTP
jgi:protein-disulfide isomerase